MRTGGRAGGSTYEIEVLARLSGRSAQLFAGWELEDIEGARTILRGSVADQAALHAVLGRLRDLGIPLAAVRLLDDAE